MRRRLPKKNKVRGRDPSVEKRTWHGRRVHPEAYAVPEREHGPAGLLRALTRGQPGGCRGRGGGATCVRVPVGSHALRLFEQPSYRAAPRDHLRVRIVQGVAVRGQTTGREALRACAEGEQLRASRMGIVQRESGEDGVLPRLWSPGQ